MGSTDSRVWGSRQNNPHVHENDREVCVSRDKFVRLLTPQAGRMGYRVLSEEERRTTTIQHWGQRKLLLSEIEFLTLYGKEGGTLVYAGAAPGNHIDLLADMFPGMNFILVDPGNFIIEEIKRPDGTKRLEIINSFFSDEMARDFRSKNDVLFISDIRSREYQDMEGEVAEGQVKEEMEQQKRWHTLMKPLASMFKFKLPYRPGKTRYLDGYVFLPIWARVRTSETRLVCGRDAKPRVWDNTEYESQCYFFNKVTRPSTFYHNVPDTKINDREWHGLDHCYDCTAEVHVLRGYFLKFPFECVRLLAKEHIPVLNQPQWNALVFSIAGARNSNNTEEKELNSTGLPVPDFSFITYNYGRENEQLIGKIVSEASAEISIRLHASLDDKRRAQKMRILGTIKMPPQSNTKKTGWTQASISKFRERR